MLRKLRVWWNKDAEELAIQETNMTAHERDIAQEDYEGKKDDSGGGGLASYARQGRDHYDDDSEKPRY
jgi:hypothetical protein